MFLIKQILRHDYTVVFESGTPGTYSKTFSPGLYEITIVGAGGGGASIYRPGAFAVPGYARGSCGGVGATLVFKVSLQNQTPLSITVGSGGSSSSGSTPSTSYTVRASSGTQSSVSGIPNVQAVAGAGDGAVQVYSNNGFTDGPGSFGQVTISGVGQENILFNSNNSPITSHGGPPYEYEKNTNFLYNDSVGQGGYVTYDNGFTNYSGGNGYVIIKRL